MTQAQRDSRGTRQKCRDIEPRLLDDIQQEIEETLEGLKDMQYLRREAGKSIHEDGMFIETTVTDSNGAAHMAKRQNPSIKTYRDALSTIRSLKRSLTLLREEEALANAKKAEEDDWEFQG